MLLRDFKELLVIVSDSRYAERIVLHIKITKFIPDDAELTLLFVRVQDIRHHNT